MQPVLELLPYEELIKHHSETDIIAIDIVPIHLNGRRKMIAINEHQETPSLLPLW